ncbi:hypothetical protein O0L34_g9453 [Tuta absoluta]|nr:hypothetical protein O0L34_g9453 [Tuta absoluta]
MVKFLVFVFAVICYVNANPLSSESGGSSEGALNTQNGYRGNTWGGQFPQWPQQQTGQMTKLPQFQWPQFQWPQIQWPNIQMPKPITPQDVESMQPAPGGVVNGMSQTMTSHTENVGGKLVTKTDGETIWNHNGHVEKKRYGN